MIYRVSKDGLSASAQPSMDGNVLADQVTHRPEPLSIWKTPMVFETPRQLLGNSKVNQPSRSLVILGSLPRPVQPVYPTTP